MTTAMAKPMGGGILRPGAGDVETKAHGANPQRSGFAGFKISRFST
jgi:hypothetical protein